MKQRIAIIGHGTVGKALYAQLQNLPNIEVVKVAVKHPAKHRELSRNILTDDVNSILDRVDIQVILEAIDDTDAAFAYAKKTLSEGKTYITASKKMVAASISALHEMEARFGGRLLYEAAVGGAIPVLRTLREHLAGEEIIRIRGIVNGTCNYILTRMGEDDLPFAKALAEAQQRGFAESDPTSDIDGWDSYYKSIILARAAFGDKPEISKVKWHGIREVGLADVHAAAKVNEKIKLVADIKHTNQRVSIDIRPTLLGSADPLYHIDRELNGIIIEGRYAGQLLLQGSGAGGNATASAMVGDLYNAPKAPQSIVRKLLLSVN
jgi:homoserine dehydrogenase